MCSTPPRLAAGRTPSSRTSGCSARESAREPVSCCHSLLPQRDSGAMMLWDAPLAPRTAPLCLFVVAAVVCCFYCCVKPSRRLGQRWFGMFNVVTASAIERRRLYFAPLELLAPWCWVRQRLLVSPSSAAECTSSPTHTHLRTHQLRFLARFASIALHLVAGNTAASHLFLFGLLSHSTEPLPVSAQWL